VLGTEVGGEVEVAGALGFVIKVTRSAAYNGFRAADGRGNRVVGVTEFG
jgi:hypothetical protein